ncbi:MAG TPA: hypothetical protein VN455_05470 [Methanotrichaceae archaeon]|nr:hypothetical protein [Methanotrichaceae archaeon]
MPRIAQVTEPMFLRVSSEDKEWLQERATALKLRPAIYARMLLSKAVAIDRQEPGKLLC